MRRIILLLVILTMPVIAVAGIALTVFLAIYPDTDPPPNLTLETTPDSIARGAYLANHVSVCVDCHSHRNWANYSGPVKPGTEGQGGEKFGSGGGLIGVVYSPNITSEHLGHWTDGEIARAITSGISRNGTALSPVMPYSGYNHLAEEDLYAIITYIRTLRPIKSQVPERRLDFLTEMLVRMMPIPYTAPSRPDPADSVVYGAYLASIAGCADCHTPKERGTPVPDMKMAGGLEFPLPDGGVVRASNITPDAAEGIGRWSKKDFVARFKLYEDLDRRKMPVQEGRNTVMPWTRYAGMSEKDLEAVFTYLQTVTPVRNTVTTHP